MSECIMYMYKKAFCTVNENMCSGQKKICHVNVNKTRLT